MREKEEEGEGSRNTRKKPSFLCVYVFTHCRCVTSKKKVVSFLDFFFSLQGRSSNRELFFFFQVSVSVCVIYGLIYVKSGKARLRVASEVEWCLSWLFFPHSPFL